MSYSCRRLHFTEVEILKQLLKVFGEAFGEVDTYQGAVPDDRYLEALLASPDFIAVAAVDCEEVVGGLTGYVLRKFERERREIYIYDLAVAAAQRRKGIATGLIREL